MKNLKIIICSLLLLITFFSFGQDSTQDTTVVTSGGTGVIDWIKNHYVAIIVAILGLYEVIARLIPTVKNISLISAIVAILNKFLPNKKELPGTDKTAKFTS